MKPFEQMTEQEQRHHIEEIHGVLYLRDDAIAIQHEEDHQQLDYPHAHECNETHKRIWHDPDVKLERVDDE